MAGERLRGCLGALTMLGVVGCAALPETPATPTPPATAQAGDTTVVAVSASQPCCPPPTLWDFLGVNAAVKLIAGGVGRVRNRLGSRFPGLEAKPPVLAITDPANAASPNPAVAAAADAKAEEDQAAQKVKAIRYLAKLGCRDCYPDVQDALIKALDDCTEEVRYEAAKGLREAAGGACSTCAAGSCCAPEALDKLRSLAYDTDDAGCFVEPSARVRRVARLAIAACGDGPGVTQVLEGPSSETTEAGNAAATAAAIDVLAQPTLADVSPAQPSEASDVLPVSYDSPREAAAPHGMLARAGVVEGRRPEGEEVAAKQAASPPDVLVRYETVIVEYGAVAGRDEAVDMLSELRRSVLQGRSPDLPARLRGQLMVVESDWTPPEEASDESLRALLRRLPTGSIGPVEAGGQRARLVRIVDRREIDRAVESQSASSRETAS